MGFSEEEREELLLNNIDPKKLLCFENEQLYQTEITNLLAQNRSFEIMTSEDFPVSLQKGDMFTLLLSDMYWHAYPMAS